MPCFPHKSHLSIKNPPHLKLTTKAPIFIIIFPNYQMGKITPKIVFLHFIIYLHCCNLSISILHPLDFLALQSIRKSLNEAVPSRFFQSWDFTADPCTFAGVFCAADRVVALNLGDPRAGSPGLTGRINPDIGKLSHLAEFTIVPGRVMGRIPQTVSQLKSLRFFAVSRNYLSGEIPAGLGFLTGLRTLDLSFNQLTGSIPGPLGSLPALSNLVLCHNRLTGPVPFLKSRSLARVDLMHNELSGWLAPYTFPPSLEYLSLSRNRFTGPVDRVLPRLTKLNFLDLSMNRFTGPIPIQIFRFPITNLQLQRNMFSGPIRPENQVTITTVDLSYNRLSGEISPFFSTVRNLYLNNNRFRGPVPGGFVDRLLDSTIQTLYLQHNFLTGIRMNPTADIPLSSSLCLQYNCMVPPLHSSCPLKAGTRKSRPANQCFGWRG